MKTLVIDPNAELPPFEQLRRQLIEQITIGQLRADTKLPAVRRLAADLALAPGTVARAYKELVSEGYLVSRGRNGTVVAPNISDEPQTQAQRMTDEYIAGWSWPSAARDHERRVAAPGRIEYRTVAPTACSPNCSERRCGKGAPCWKSMRKVSSTVYSRLS